MSPLILSAVLLAALLHATWNAMIKVSGDRLVIMGLTAFLSAVFAFPLVLAFPLPAPASWPYLAMSVLLHGTYMLLLVRAYGLGDFAQVYPLARGSAPLLTACLGFLFLGEALSLGELAGMLLIVGGIFSLALERSRSGTRLSRAGLFYSLLTGVFIAAYSLIDGTGARLAGNSHSFTMWMFFLDGFFVPVVALARRRSVFWPTARTVWKPALIVAIISAIGYWIVIWAFSVERIAPVAVLRETSVLFAMLIAVLFLKEQLTRLRISIILLIVTGIVLLSF